MTRFRPSFRAKTHGNLATLASSLWTSSTPPTDLGRYLLRQGIAHLLMVGQDDAARHLLRDCAYLVARLRSENAAGVDGVAADAAATAGAGDTWAPFFRRWRATLRRGTAHWPSMKIFVQLGSEEPPGQAVREAVDGWLAQGLCDWPWLRAITKRQRSDVAESLDGSTVHRGDIRLAFVEQGRLYTADARGVLVRWGEDGAPTVFAADAGLPCEFAFRDGQVAAWLNSNRLCLWQDDGVPIRVWEDFPYTTALAFLPSGDLAASVRDGSIVCHVDDGERTPRPGARVWSLGDLGFLIQRHNGKTSVCIGGSEVVASGIPEIVSAWKQSSDTFCLAVILDEDDRSSPDNDVGVLVFHAAGGRIKLARVRAIDKPVSRHHDNFKRLSDAAFSVLEFHAGSGRNVIGTYVVDADESGPKYLEPSFHGAWDDERMVIAPRKAGDAYLVPTARAHLPARAADEGVIEPEHFHEFPVLVSRQNAIRVDDARAATFSERTIYIWDARAPSGARVAAASGHIDKVLGALALAGEEVLTWSEDGVIRVWDATTGQPLRSLGDVGLGIAGLTVLHDRLLVSWRNFLPHQFMLWDLTDGTCVGWITSPVRGETTYDFRTAKDEPASALACGPVTLRVDGADFVVTAAADAVTRVRMTPADLTRVGTSSAATTAAHDAAKATWRRLRWCGDESVTPLVQTAGGILVVDHGETGEVVFLRRVAAGEVPGEAARSAATQHVAPIKAGGPERGAVSVESGFNHDGLDRMHAVFGPMAERVLEGYANLEDSPGARAAFKAEVLRRVEELMDGVDDEHDRSDLG